MSRIQILFLFFCCSVSAQTIEPIAFDSNVTQEEWANGLHLKRCSTVLQVAALILALDLVEGLQVAFCI